MIPATMQQRKQNIAWRLDAIRLSLKSATHNLDALQRIDPDLDPLLLPAVRSLRAKVEARMQPPESCRVCGAVPECCPACGRAFEEVAP